MANYVVVNARGNGDCLLNAYVLNMAFQFNSGENQDKWLKIFNEKKYQGRYIALANQCMATTSLERPALTEEASAQEIFEHFKAFFGHFDLYKVKEREQVQLIMSPLMRAQMIEAVKNPQTRVLDHNNKSTRISTLLNQAFKTNLKEMVYAYITHGTQPGFDNQNAGGFFQDHPAFKKKLDDLFKAIDDGVYKTKEDTFDFEKFVDDNHSAAQAEDKRPEELIANHLRPILKDFAAWFEKEGKEAFYNHRTHGFSVNGAQLNPFAYGMLSTLYGTTVQTKNYRNSFAQDGFNFHSDAQPWRIEGHRFYYPQKVRVTTQAQREQYGLKDDDNYYVPNYEATSDDLLMNLEYSPGHYKACIPYQGEIQQRVEAQISQDKAKQAKKKPTFKTDPWNQSGKSISVLVGAGFAFGALVLWPLIPSVPFLLLTMLTSFASGMLISDYYDLEWPSFMANEPEEDVSHDERQDQPKKPLAQETPLVDPSRELSPGEKLAKDALLHSFSLHSDASSLSQALKSSDEHQNEQDQETKPAQKETHTP